MDFGVREADLGEELSPARRGGGEDDAFGAEGVEDGEVKGEGGAQGRWWRV